MITSTDITALAVRVGNLRVGLTERTEPPSRGADEGRASHVADKPPSPEERSSAVVVTISDAALARARESEGREEAPQPSAARLAVRAAIRAEASRTAEAMQKQFAWMAESVRRFDETGELWTGDMNGQLVRCEGKYANCAPKDPEAYFDRLRAGLDGYRKGIEHQLQVAASAASW